MDQSESILIMLMGAWGVVTVALIALVIYRTTLSTKEDDQIFLNPSEQIHYQEQQEIISKLSRLTGPIIGLAVASGALLLGSAGVWIYRGFKNF
jgi:hypothetical protein